MKRCALLWLLLPLVLTPLALGAWAWTNDISLPAACAEAWSLATMAGVDPQKVFDAIRGGLAGSTVMNAKVPMMIAGNFKPGFRIDLHIKDLNNALDTGHGLGTPMLLTAQVQEMLQWLHNNGSGGDDHSAILKYYEKLTGMRICDAE